MGKRGQLGGGGGGGLEVSGFRFGTVHLSLLTVLSMHYNFIWAISQHTTLHIDFNQMFFAMQDWLTKTPDKDQVTWILKSPISKLPIYLT